jgi:hypothetical protein
VSLPQGKRGMGSRNAIAMTASKGSPLTVSVALKRQHRGVIQRWSSALRPPGSRSDSSGTHSDRKAVHLGFRQGWVPGIEASWWQDMSWGSRYVVVRDTALVIASTGSTASWSCG